MQQYYPLFTAIPLAIAFINLLITKVNKRAGDYLAIIATGVLAWMSIKMLFVEPFSYHVGGHLPPWGILLVSDCLSSLMLFVINVIAFLSIIFSL